MDTSVDNSRSHLKSRIHLKPLLVALTLALPSAAFAVSADVVTTRADQNIDQQYGRDSVYGFSPESKPLSPERTSGSHFFYKFHTTSGAHVSGLYEGYVPKAQQGMTAASRYTGSEMRSEADTSVGTLGRPNSDVSVGGNDEHAVVMIVAMEETLEPSALDDGTATQYDRGYYQDPEESQIILIAPDIVAAQDVGD